MVTKRAGRDSAAYGHGEVRQTGLGKAFQATFRSAAESVRGKGRAHRRAGSSSSAMFRFVHHVRELIRVLRGRDTLLRERTAQIQAQLEQLRAERAAQEAALERQALQQVRRAVEELRGLQASLTAAEEAAVRFADRVALKAREELEADLRAQEERVLGELAKTEALSVLAEGSRGGASDLETSAPSIRAHEPSSSGASMEEMGVDGSGSPDVGMGMQRLEIEHPQREDPENKPPREKG